MNHRFNKLREKILGLSESDKEQLKTKLTPKLQKVIEKQYGNASPDKIRNTIIELDTKLRSAKGLTECSYYCDKGKHQKCIDYQIPNCNCKCHSGEP